MPEYEGRVAFVDAVTDDPAAEGVLRRYPGQYIPTSVFVDGDGEVADTYVGPLTDVELRGRLDSLLAAGE
jgi:hypothetical protein